MLLGLAGTSCRGSLSTMMSKSTSLSESEDMWLEKQKEYSPTVCPVKM